MSGASGPALPVRGEWRRKRAGARTLARAGAEAGSGRVVGLAVLVLAVIGLHAGLTARIADRMAGLRADRSMPARMEVRYVRQMTLAAPPPTAAPAAPPPIATLAAPTARTARPLRAEAPRPASAPPAPEALDAARMAATSASAPAAAASGASEAPSAAAASAPALAAPGGVDASVAALPAAAGPPASAASSSGAAFQWPASTRVSYHLTGNYRGAVDGTAQVEWIRDGTHYQVHVDFLVGASFAPVITQRSTSDGEIGTDGLIPHRYDQQTRVLGSDRPLQTVLFDPFGVTLANGQRQSAPPRVQDSASQFIQLTYLFSTRPGLLQVGGSVDIPLALPRKVDVWTYDVTEQVVLETPFGPLDALHLVPRNPPGPNALRVEIWFAPQLRYFPARLRIEQSPGTYVDLMIEKPPEVAG